MENQQRPPSDPCGGADPKIQHCRCCIYEIVKMDPRRLWPGNQNQGNAEVITDTDGNVPGFEQEITIKHESLEADVGLESGAEFNPDPDVMQQVDPDRFLGGSTYPTVGHEGELFDNILDSNGRMPFQNDYVSYGGNSNFNLFGDRNPDARGSEGGIADLERPSSFSSFSPYNWGTGTNHAFAEAGDKLDTEGLYGNYGMLGSSDLAFIKKDVLLTEGMPTTNDLDITGTGSLIGSQPSRNEGSPASTTILESSKSSMEPSPPQTTQQSQLNIVNEQNLGENQAVAPSSRRKRVLAEKPERFSPRLAGGKFYNCCKIRFSNKASLDAHQRQHQLGDAQPFLCQTCHRHYASETTYNAHLKRHRECKRCGEQLRNAPRASMKGNILCDKCKLINDNDASDVEHNDDSSSLANGRSSVPGSRTSTRQAKLAQNLLHDCSEPTVEEDDDGRNRKIGRIRFKCNVCPKTFVNHARFKSHMNSHDMKSKDPFVCTQPGCDATFGSHHGLQNHRVKHMRSAYPCDRCHMSFKMQHHRKLHYSTHFKCKEFACKICGKWFGSFATLKTHQKKASVSCRPP